MEDSRNKFINSKLHNILNNVMKFHATPNSSSLEGESSFAQCIYAAYTTIRHLDAIFIIRSSVRVSQCLPSNLYFIELWFRSTRVVMLPFGYIKKTHTSFKRKSESS
jgi:hypothetical protein